jgi:hypothetical protein
MSGWNAAFNETQLEKWLKKNPRSKTGRGASDDYVRERYREVRSLYLKLSFLKKTGVRFGFVYIYDYEFKTNWVKLVSVSLAVVVIALGLTNHIVAMIVL